MKIPNANFLIEASWEVCNKVGGIYTVVKSKAAIANKAYDDYLLVGPYLDENQDVNFVPEEPPKEIKTAFDALQGEGIGCHYGTWEIKGSPKAVLIDSRGLNDQKDEIKKRIWEGYQVDTLFSAGDFEPPMIWAWAVGKFVEKLADVYSSKSMVTHCHEWLAGIAILYLKMHNSRVKTVFTTHATMLGRAIAGSGEPLYSIINQINPEEEAKKRGINDKFTTEKACAHATDVFTTVSEITGFEAEKLLGRKPDVLVLNGLDIGRFPTFEETSVKHMVTRTVIREFLTYYFFPYYSFDLDHTLHYFILGRNEFRNKGIDIYIKALSRLNERLKKENPNRTVAAFFFIPSEQYGIRTEVLENKTYYRQLQDFVHENIHQIQERITQNLVSGKMVSENTIFTKDFEMNNKKHILRFKRTGQPGISTHNINYNNDQIVKALREAGLENKEEDRVKVIYYPVYLTGTDGLLDLAYYDVIAGNHLGIFTSYYEPWGYTPLEAAAFGVPSITSDLAGFGQYIEKQTDTSKSTCGIKVLKRMNKNDEEITENLSAMMLDYAKLNRHQRIQNKLDASRLAKLADWGELFDNYIEAHNQALEK